MTYGQLAGVLFPHGPAPAGVRRGPTTKWHRPNHLLAVDAANEFYGLGGDMVPPTRAEAMSVPAMARARHIITTAARLPIRVEPSGYPATALIDQPDPQRTRAAVLTDTLDSLLFDGVAVWKVTARYADGRPRHAEYVALERVTRDDRGGPWRVDDTAVPADDLLWFEGPHEGVRFFAGRALRAAVRLDRAYSNTANNPAVAMELHQTTADPLTEDEIGALVASARDAVASRGVLYTNSAVELRTHAAAAENLLISGRNAAAVDIARAVGLPAAILDAHAPGSSGTYTNTAARLREARDLGADMYAQAITARLSLPDILPNGVACGFVWDSLLRATFAERMEGYAAAIDAGVYTAEECRAFERLEPLPQEGTTTDD